MMFDCPVFIISLQSATERRQKVKQEFERLAVPFTFFDAVDGRKFSMSEREDYDGVRRRRYFGKDLTGGELGCLLSHRGIYQKMVNEQIPYALVFEDDARLHDDFPSVVESLLSCPVKYDLVRFLSSDKVARLTQRKVAEFAGGYSLNRLLTTPGGAHGYIITLDGAGKLLRATRRNWRPIDTLMGHVWSTGLHAFIVQPGLVWQDLSLQSSIGDDRFIKPQINPVFRGFYKLWEGCMKRLSYFKSLPVDLACIKR